MEYRLKKPDEKTINNIVSRAHYLLNQVIFMANNDREKDKGDPKIGGHSSASSGAIHILGALHLFVKSGFDHICNKPHASPADHSFNYLMDLFLNKDLSKLTVEEANVAMASLRAFPKDNEYVLQSYHSAYDPDYHNFLPTGTVGIPPVNIGYLAHAYRFAEKQGHNVPKDAHFWAIMGDAEFREGSLLEAVPDFAERELGNLTWIVDYNRQSLDGHRITNKEIMHGTDADRIGNTMLANGWDVIQVRHGSVREKLFKTKNGEAYKTWLEKTLTDYELQTLILISDAKELKKHTLEKFKELKAFLNDISDEEFQTALHDIGGNDIWVMKKALEKSKENPKRPCMIVAHTIKGWHLKMAATAGCHSALPSRDEMLSLRQAQGLKDDEWFARFDMKTPEAKFLAERGEELYGHIEAQHKLKSENQKHFLKAEEFGAIPDSMNINLKMASYPHTQWMLGQLTAKLTRISNTPLDEKKLIEKQKALIDTEKVWKLPSEMLVPMAPDVGTSTNLNPAMDGKVYGPENTDDLEAEFDVKDTKRPDLVPGNEANDRFIRFDIAEANVMSCMGSYGKMREILGIPLMPLMTVYDFFVKRALDQFFYNLYWQSSFIMVGTPSGVTLSPEGAQHGWKSDIQIPNQITWEPFYCQELDWIFSDAMKRHIMEDNKGRGGVYIRGVTRGADQKTMMKLLKTQKRFKVDQNQLLHHKDFVLAGSVDESTIGTIADNEIMEIMKEGVLKGAYYLINFEGYAGYEAGDNVVNIFSLGSLTTEAIKASAELLKKGIYANVIVVTCTDLLIGNNAHEDNYNYLRNELGVNADLYLQPMQNGAAVSGDYGTLSGRRIPIVSVHDGEPGLMDNIGSIVGVRQETLAVRKHSRCGRPVEIFKYHNIDADAVVEACGKALSETALEQVKVSTKALDNLNQPQATTHWKELWPKQNK